uniref:E1 domain-containing protein n=1 Tax=Sinocyclocheilus grahami TaxID=75366 RepID=A0A672K3R2_SINGR
IFLISLWFAVITGAKLNPKSPSLSQALAMTEVNGPVSPHVAEPQIAMFCGRQLLHMNTESGQWEPDPQGRQGCFTQPSKILSYCQEV